VCSQVFVFSSQVVSEARPTVEGLATAGATIRVNDASGAAIGETTADSSGFWSLRLSTDLKVGSNELGLQQQLGSSSTVTAPSVTYKTTV
jgi:hypothetical protein